MDGHVTARVEGALGRGVRAARPVGGGCIADAYRVELDDGSAAFVKTKPAAPGQFFAVEADGLRWLGQVEGGVPTPDVLAVDDDLLVLSWVEATTPTSQAARRLGRELAATHRAGAPCFGHQRDGFIGSLPLPNRTADTWPEFYAECRVLPYLRDAADQGSISGRDVQAVERLCERLDELAGPAERPARVHGDLWSGNVHWASDRQGGDQAHLIDPAAHGGHRETDLAMLALFGLPHLEDVLAAYDEAYPLADGWQGRVALHQLHPLLVHAVLFGGGYGAQAGTAARRAAPAAGS